jgi:hypothetical protein
MISRNMQKKYLNKYCIYVGGVPRTFREFTAAKPYYKFTFTLNEVVYCTVPLNDNIFLLFCSTLVPLKMLLNVNTKVEFIHKVRVINFGRHFAENVGYVFRSGNCVKLHYDEVSHLKNYRE